MADSTFDPQPVPPSAAPAGREDRLRRTGAPDLGLRLWEVAAPQAVIQVVHGLAEHSARYAGLAADLNRAGHAVIAHDVRGHGLTAAAGGTLGHMAEPDGWPALVSDLAAVRLEAEARWPGRPIVLFGHSMGSVLALAALESGDAPYAAAIFSGPPGLPPPTAGVGLLLARLEALRLGRQGASPILQALSFGAYARGIDREPSDRGTGFDWLSRDPGAVAAYIADPWCGFHASVGSWAALVRGLVAATSAAAVRRLPAGLPLLIVAGAADPVGGKGKAVRALANRLRAAGLTGLELLLYPGARHELLNETNQDEVRAALLDWLQRQDLGG